MTPALTSSANGTCDVGNSVELTVTCGGPSCGVPTLFPHLQCSTDPLSSQTHLSRHTELKSILQLQQQDDNTVSTAQDLKIDGANFLGIDDGHSRVSYGPSNVPPCGTSPGTGSTSPTGDGPPTGFLEPGGTKASGVGPASSLASSRNPSLSSGLFGLFVIMSIFRSQLNAQGHMLGPIARKFKIFTSGALIFSPILWLFVFPARVYGQCTTTGIYPVRFLKSHNNYSNI